MNIGKMSEEIEIAETRVQTDDEGFGMSVPVVLAKVRASREQKTGSQKWANLSAFAEVTDIFRIRCIPGVKITTDLYIVFGGERYDITYVRDVGKMYIEMLAVKREATNG